MLYDKTLSNKDGVVVDSDFRMTRDVKARMEKLCGATNFSLGLRNSEHAARYELIELCSVQTVQ